MIGLRPAFVLEIGEEVLAGHRPGRPAEQGDGLANAGLAIGVSANLLDGCGRIMALAQFW